MTTRTDNGVSNDRLWTADDVAEFCQVKTSVVKRWVKTTNIPYIELGRKRRFDPDEIKLWIGHQKRGYNARGEERLVNIT